MNLVRMLLAYALVLLVIAGCELAMIHHLHPFAINLLGLPLLANSFSTSRLFNQSFFAHSLWGRTCLACCHQPTLPPKHKAPVRRRWRLLIYQRQKDEELGCMT